jgi:class 3 adenylate cyclase
MPCHSPDLRAVELAMELRREFADLASGWRRVGADVGLGIGIASGHATIGVIGDEGRYDYTPIGTCVNLAARLSDRAADDEILLGTRTVGELGDRVRARSLGTMEVRGLSRDVEAFALDGLTAEVPA